MLYLELFIVSLRRGSKERMVERSGRLEERIGKGEGEGGHMSLSHQTLTNTDPSQTRYSPLTKHYYYLLPPPP